MANYLVHITGVTERWDTLAWLYYGDATNYSPIIMANPAVPIEPVFEQGITILVPVLAQTQAPPSANLPPWLRVPSP
jgi:phage tail protein X